jgi:hypothetical protein
MSIQEASDAYLTAHLTYWNAQSVTARDEARVEMLIASENYDDVCAAAEGSG